MAKLRKGVSYRHFERPYTRKSKFRNKSFIKSVPVCKVVRFDMGISGEGTGIYFNFGHIF